MWNKHILLFSERKNLYHHHHSHKGMINLGIFFLLFWNKIRPHSAASTYNGAFFKRRGHPKWNQLNRKKKKELSIVSKLEIVVFLLSIATLSHWKVNHYVIQWRYPSISNKCIELSFTLIVVFYHESWQIGFCQLLNHGSTLLFYCTLRPAPNADGRPQPGPVRVHAEFLSIGCIKSQSK